MSRIRINWSSEDELHLAGWYSALLLTRIPNRSASRLGVFPVLSLIVTFCKSATQPSVITACPSAAPPCIAHYLSRLLGNHCCEPLGIVEDHAMPGISDGRDAYAVGRQDIAIVIGQRLLTEDIGPGNGELV